MAKDLEGLRAFIAYQVREGFESVHEIIENATEYALEKYNRNDLHPEIKRMTAELIAAHQTEQANWVDQTDCDRLDEAFAALNRQGIVARQNFSCCNNCGFIDIWDEIEEEEKAPARCGVRFLPLASNRDSHRIRAALDGSRVRRRRRGGFRPCRQQGRSRATPRRP